MFGRIALVDRYTRFQIQRQPQILFVFGDNLTRSGFGGQAAAARGEPNSVGIVTKLSPSKFLTDDDIETVRPAIVQAFNRLAIQLDSGGDIIWPADGVGTGLAELPTRAPILFQKIELCRETLFSMARSISSL